MEENTRQQPLVSASFLAMHQRHAEHYAKNRTSLRGLDHDTLFFG